MTEEQDDDGVNVVAEVESFDEIEEPLGTVEEPGIDAWDPDFPMPVSAPYQRIDSRKCCVLPERYVFRPLDAMSAAKELDKLSSSPGAKAFISSAFFLQQHYRDLRSLVIEEFRASTGEDTTAEDVEIEVAGRFVDAINVAIEDFYGAVGEGTRLVEFALSWIQRCDVRRVPLPSSGDTGGSVMLAKGPASWAEYYQGRYALLIRLGAFCAWESLGPFLVPRMGLQR